MTNNKMPSLSIDFKGLGASAVARGEKGVLALIVKDSTDQSFDYVEYKTIGDFTTDEQAKFTEENVKAIKDALQGIPLKLMVFRMGTTTPTLTGFTVHLDSSSVAIGGTIKASVINPVPTGAVLGSIAWSSKDETKATIDQNGNVTGVAVGTVDIEGDVDGIKETSSLEVTATTLLGEEEKIDNKSISQYTNGLIDVLRFLGTKVPRNCWVAMADSSVMADNDDLVTWIKAEVKNNKKRYKGLVYKASITDDPHIVNFTNEHITEKGGDRENGYKAIPYLAGMLAGLSLNMSSVALTLDKYEDVEEKDDKNTAISNGEFILFNDEGHVKVCAGVNSLVTLGEAITEEMTQINTIEKLDLMYCDIHDAWKNSYFGKYPNNLNNQMLLISAINGYFKSIALDSILDINFNNKSMIDIEKQRIANYPKYTQEVVDTWDDNKVMAMTVGRQVILVGSIKINGIMEDMEFDIFF